MKTRILITAVTVVLWGLSNAAIAGSTVDVYQRGNSNQVTVTQSGTMQQSSTKIDQNGYDVATITQVGNSGSSGNVVEVVQDGVSDTTTANTATINQNAGGNTAKINQAATLPVQVPGTGLNTGSATTSFSNTATITQDGIDNSVASIDQTGNTNTATLSQDSGNSGTISQTGNSNTATVEQREVAGTPGGSATAANNDTAIVNQQGTSGTVTVTQSGAAAFHNATVTQDATSANVEATVTQSGTYNIATVTQSNTYNIANVTQSGFGAGSTYASGGNEVLITQDGASASGASDTANATQLTGNTNYIEINQHRGDGSVVNVTQDGSSNTATVTQNP
jgi:hypothetical protein